MIGESVPSLDAAMRERLVRGKDAHVRIVGRLYRRNTGHWDMRLSYVL